MTDSTGAISETMDYYPFGALRLDQQASGGGGGPIGFNEQRKFIGQEYDADTNLAYLNARYYNATLAKFTSEDPQFWSNNQNLLDPQSLNSYSYANNNPITLSDPSGKNAMAAQVLLSTGIGFEGIGAAFDGTIFGAPAGLVIGGLGLGVLAVGGGLYYFDKIQGNHAKGNSGVAGKTTTGAPNPQISGNNQNEKKDKNSNKNNNWGNKDTLQQHFDDHGADFGAKSPEDYATKANDWINNAKNNPNVESYLDKRGYTSYFDSETNTRGATNNNGKTATYFKGTDNYNGNGLTSREYFEQQKSQFGVSGNTK